MADLYESDFGTAFYRTRDPIKNLKISVHLEKVTSASIVPQAAVEKDLGHGLEMQDLQRQQVLASQKDIDDYTLTWQEKIFSQREVELYSNEASCEDVIQKKYHDQVLMIREIGRPTKRLFTYTTHDKFTHDNEKVKFMTTSPNEQPTFLVERVSTVRHRKPASGRQRGVDDNDIVPKMNIVEQNPSKEALKKNRIINTPEAEFLIMADLSPKERDGTAEDEYVLATIKFDSNGVLSIQPDFNNGRKPYRIETSSMGRDVFEFTIEHKSKHTSRQDQDKETKMYRELYSRHSEFLAACVGSEFEMPPQNVLRYLIYGEIVSAKNFEYDNLFIHFFLELPRFWRANPHTPLSGVTHTCATKVEGVDNVAYFSFPFHFELFYKGDHIDPEKREELPHWPQMFIEVTSLDSWQRTRTEGYGYFTIPSTPGVYNQTVICWRPTGRTLRGNLRRFFIGGSPELEDPTYMAVPLTFEGTRLSKLGFRTETSGSVKVRMNVIQQAQGFLQSADKKKKVGSLMDRLGVATSQRAILSVLDSFQRARKRMIAARENVIQDFKELTIGRQQAETDEL